MPTSSKITRWSNTQAVRETVCSHCNAQPGNSCRTPKNRVVGQPHGVRTGLYLNTIGRAEFERRHRGYPGKVWDSDIE